MLNIRWGTLVLVSFQILGSVREGLGSTWSEWWTYDGISGPDFWGLVNPEWYLCSKGKKQSPINIDPRSLLYDTHLKHIHIDKHRVSGSLINTGHEVKLQFEDPAPHIINITGGPLSYQYRVSEILIHFGSIDSLGSEHTVDGQSFPAEIQIVGYNSDLYGNLTHAQIANHGLVIVALLAQIGKKGNEEWEVIAQELKRVRYKGQQVRIRHLSVNALLPETTDYMTYEGSMTQPGCHETVTWIIMNRPLYITNEHLQMLRDIMQGDQENQKVPMENNCRPIMPLSHRVVRTNINFPNHKKGCTMNKEMHYQANSMDRS